MAQQAAGGRPRSAIVKDGDVLNSTVDPIHPARIYGELNQRLADDTVVIGDGGDFVSFAGKFWWSPNASRTLARPRTLRMSGHRARLRDGLGRGQTLVTDRSAHG